MESTAYKVPKDQPALYRRCNIFSSNSSKNIVFKNPCQIKE
jgi:hypothetical protein